MAAIPANKSFAPAAIIAEESGPWSGSGMLINFMRSTSLARLAFVLGAELALELLDAAEVTAASIFCGAMRRGAEQPEPDSRIPLGSTKNRNRRQFVPMRHFLKAAGAPYGVF